MPVIHTWVEAMASDHLIYIPEKTGFLCEWAFLVIVLIFQDSMTQLQGIFWNTTFCSQTWNGSVSYLERLCRFFVDFIFLRVKLFPRNLFSRSLSQPKLELLPFFSNGSVLYLGRLCRFLVDFLSISFSCAWSFFWEFFWVGPLANSYWNYYFFFPICSLS